MNLSSKQKALGATVGIFLLATFVGMGIDFIARNVSTETIMYVFGIGFLLFFGNIMYQLFLSRFEYEEKVQNLVDNK